MVSLHARLAISSNTYHLLPKFNQFLDARAFYIISRKTGLFSVTTTDSMWVLLRIRKYLIFLLDLVLKAHIYLNFVLVLSILVTMKFVYFAAVTHN